MSNRRNVALLQPALDAVEAAAVEAAKMQFPVANRRERLRGEMTAQLRALDNEEKEIADAELLLDRIIQSAREAIEEQRSDIREAKELLLRGIQPADAPAITQENQS